MLPPLSVENIAPHFQLTPTTSLHLTHQTILGMRDTVKLPRGVWGGLLTVQGYTTAPEGCLDSPALAGPHPQGPRRAGFLPMPRAVLPAALFCQMVNLPTALKDSTSSSCKMRKRNRFRELTRPMHKSRRGQAAFRSRAIHITSYGADLLEGEPSPCGGADAEGAPQRPSGPVGL